MSYRVVHYINQFFAQIGGEEMAHVAPELRKGFVGPGMAFNQAWKGEAEIVATVVCGDSYFAEHEKDAKAQILAWVKEQKPDLFIAGPAFNAGRYGYACANICKTVEDELHIPVLTGMYEENPGADLKDKVLIVATTNSAAGMRKAAPTMAALALKLMKGEQLGASCEEGYMPNGIRRNFFEKERGSQRAVKMLLNKLAGKPFVTEYPMPSFDRVAPNPGRQGSEQGHHRAVHLRRHRPEGQPGSHRELVRLPLRRVLHQGRQRSDGRDL
jgi:glycine reductase